MIDYDDLRKEQAEKRAKGELMGIGISSFTEIVGAGPSHDFDILGLKMFDSLRDPGPPDRQGARPDRRPDPGPGPRDDLRPDHRRGARLPGAGHQDRVRRHRHRAVRPRDVRAHARRRSPAPRPRWPSRKIQAKARTLAAHLLEASEDDLEWEPGKFSVKGSPDRFKTIQEIAFAAYTNHPAGDGGGPRGGRLLRPAEPDLPVRQLHLRRRHRQGHRPGQRPPLRRGRRLRQHHQPDDRRRPDPRRPDDGPRPVAVRGDHYDEHGNNLAGTFMDYLVPTAMETPGLGARARPSPRRRIIRSAPREWGSRPRSGPRRRSPTPWSMPCGTSASGTSTSRSRPRRSGRSSTRRASRERDRR